MEGQRGKSNGNRRRKRRAKGESKAQHAPVLIAARRPDSPRLGKISRRNIAASARPKRAPTEGGNGTEGALLEPGDPLANGRGSALSTPLEDGGVDKANEAEKPRRVVRIAAAPSSTVDEREQRRQRLLERLSTCEGRSAISRIADELFESGGVPEEQPYQIQLLEHVHEQRAWAALRVMARLLDRQSPIKRPILDQRLRRLEEEADEVSLRTEARELRRRLRSAGAAKPAQVS
jgi:hypothetical protein